MNNKELLQKAIKDFYGEGRPDKEVPEALKRNLKDVEYVKSLSPSRQRLKKVPRMKVCWKDEVYYQKGLKA